MMFSYVHVKSDDRTKYIGDDGSGFISRKKKRECFSYGNRSYRTAKDYFNDMRISPIYLGRQRKSTYFVYLKCFPYRNSEGSSQLVSCLYYDLINSDPRLGIIFDKHELLSP